MDDELEGQFRRELLDSYQRAINELGYRATVYLRMITEYGAIGAAEHLVRNSQVSEGFTKLWELGRLDLSIEASMLRPEYAPLFSQQDLVQARRILREYRYVAPWDKGGANQ